MDDLMKEYSNLANELIEEQKVKKQTVSISGRATAHS
jgi:hypothetical protein